MPIRPEFRQFYSREWREVTRPRILARAGNCCEQCHKPNHRRLWVYRPAGAMSSSGQSWTLHKKGQAWTYCLFGAGGNFQLFGKQWREARRIKVVLTIAHLNHTPGDDRDENLKALCQWCHLNHDQVEHAKRARETRIARKDQARPLFAALELTA